MIRILHISDFHLNNKTLIQWKEFLKDSLFQKLNELKETKGFDLVAFTGDMLDKGGNDFGSAAAGFDVFEKEVIIPITSELNIPKDKFFIVPGNHDIERDEDSKRDEIGSREYFDSLENISEYFHGESKDFTGMHRIESYKNFENKFYATSNIKKLSETNFGSSFKFKVGKTCIGIACLNSAWRCYDNEDHGRLIIIQEELNKHVKFLSKQDYNIALIHHPLDSLIEIEKKIIPGYIQKDFDLLLFGHSHSAFTSITSGFTGKIFYNMAPSGLNNLYSNDREYSNGFCTIDINDEMICAEYWRYNNKTKNFVLNTDAGLNGSGRFCEEFPKNKVLKNQNNIQNLLDNIREDHYERMNDLMIGLKAEIKTVTNLKEAFVIPPIEDIKKKSKTDQQEIKTLNEIINNKWNQVFFGGSECGKTALLYRLVFEYVESFDLIGKIPIYINFEELGNKQVFTTIKEYLRCNSDMVKLLLKTNQIILLVDNLNYQNYQIKKDQFNKFNKFLKDNPNLQIIATSDGGYMGTVPLEFYEKFNIPFEAFFIKNLRVKEIKRLMRQWLPSEDSVSEENRLAKMITDFQSFSLPSTAMSVSLFLWSSEYSKTKPVNQAVLLEIYIEIILQKLNIENIYRDTFDFTNKSQLLASIAQAMLEAEEDNYSLKYSAYIKIIENYLNLVGFDFDSSVIGEYFLERKIFHKYQNNKIKFSYSCFFHFFLAKRMQYNKEFYEHIIDEKRYHKFIKEIDYYTGLTRSNKELLELISSRFQNEFKSTDFILDVMNGRWDKHFMVTPEKSKEDEFEPAVKNVSIEKIKESRPSEELLDDFHNRRLEKIANPSEILRKKTNLNLELLLITTCNVLRNSEGVEDKALKQKVYNNIIKYSMIWMVLYREYIVKYVIENNRLPSNISLEVGLINTLKYMPIHVQGGMNRHLGTSKLSSVIKNKINADLTTGSITKSDLELFLSVIMYADVEGRDYPKFLNKLISRVGNNPVRDFTFLKLIEYYYKRTKEGSDNEALYLDMLADLKIRSEGLPKRLRHKVIKSLKKGKDEFIKDYL